MSEHPGLGEWIAGKKFLVVEDVDTVRQKLTVKVKMFLGREMPVEVDLQDVVKV